MTKVNAGKPWLQSEIDALLVRFQQRMHPLDIAEAHGRTAGAVIGKLASFGLVVPRGKGYRRVEADEWISFAEIRAHGKSNGKLGDD